MRYLFLFFIKSTVLFSQSYQIADIINAPESSFRGLSVVNEKIAWLSGSNGFIGFTKNSGKDWNFFQVKDYESFDFRSIYAFDEKRAVIANAGSPAIILFTEDAGLHWNEVYRNENINAFIDGVIFWNKKEGLAFGDPINNRMLLLKTFDGGKSWQELPEYQRPLLNEGEASFAASGTTIRSLGNGKIIIATGGKISRLWISDDYGSSWKFLSAPVLQGASSQGIFSFDFKNKKKGIIVGGDYKKDTLKTDHIFLTNDGGKNWKKPIIPTGGYRSCVEYLDDKTVIATGTSGTDISYDEGLTWQLLSTQGYNVVRKSENSRLVILAGEKGKAGILIRK